MSMLKAVAVVSTLKETVPPWSVLMSVVKPWSVGSPAPLTCHSEDGLPGLLFSAATSLVPVVTEAGALCGPVQLPRVAATL